MAHSLLKSFVASEHGALAVEWPVVAAGLVGLGLAIMLLVGGGVEDLSGETQVELANIDPAASAFVGTVTTAAVDVIAE